MCEMSHDWMSHRSETHAFHVSPGCERLPSGVPKLFILFVMTFAVAAVFPTQHALAQLSQSPIDIRLKNVTAELQPLLTFTYSSSTELNVVNTGSPDEESTVRAVVLPGAGKVRLSNKDYFLKQFHFHTPSEHQIQGHETPLGMHLVHQATDNELLVCEVFLQAGSKVVHTELDKIFRDLPANAQEARVVAGFNLNKILPYRRASFRYMGSLTTAPYTEGVRWIVFPDRIRVSDSQLQHFKSLFPNEDSREIQPLNGRKIYFSYR